jgi:VanZ family protein
LSAGRIIALWSPVVGFMIAVLALADQGAAIVGFEVPDKLVHLVSYALLGLLSMRATHGGLLPIRVGPSAVALAITIAFGAVDEWNQTRYPLRDSSVGDWLADVVGAAAAVAFVRVWAGRRRDG